MEVPESLRVLQQFIEDSIQETMKRDGLSRAEVLRRDEMEFYGVPYNG